MNRQEILDLIAAADAAIEKQEYWRFGPNGFGPYPPEPLPQPLPPAIRRPMKIGKPRRNSKQGRRERGE